MKNSLFFILFLACSFSIFSQKTDSKKNKVTRSFYKDSTVSVERWYGNDKKIDSFKTYFKTGQLSEEFYFRKGKFHGKCYKYNIHGKKIATFKYDNGKHIETIRHKLTFKDSVQNIAKKKSHPKKYYYRDSIVSLKKMYGTDNKIVSIKTYYPTGTKNEIFHFKQGRYQGASYKFNRSGEKITTWEFDNGKLLKRIDHKLDFNENDEEKIRSLNDRIIKLNDSIKNNPKSIKLRLQRANIRNLLGNRVLALHDFHTALKNINKLYKNKKSKPPGELLGKLYDSMSSIYASYEMDSHTSHFRYLAQKAAPENNIYKYNLGAYLYHIKSYRPAIYYLNKVLKQWKGHAFSHRALAALYTDFEDFERAMYHINMAFPKEQNLIKFGVGTPERDIRTIRGFLHHKLGNSEQGIVDLTKAIKLNKNNSFAYRNLGVIYHDLGYFKLACQYLQKAKDLGYEKTHDRYDLQAYLDNACQKADREEELVAESKPIKTSRIIDKPYVYPNPGKDLVRIKNLSFERFTYEIYDYTSKLVLRNSSINGSVIIADLPQGVYILNVLSNDGLIETFRIIKE